MSDVYIMGVDMIKFGRFPDKTVPQLGAQAALMALDDAGLTIQDMQALYCGNLGQASYRRQQYDAHYRDQHTCRTLCTMTHLPYLLRQSGV